MNWKGKNGKLALADLKLSNLIAETVNSFFGSKMSNNSLVEGSIKEWLKQAPNRIAQKIKRQIIQPSGHLEAHHSDID
ncbi:unnamed protein product [Allacma fusca]|uniref:Uncharacterized protein n=1 Tax=Allacma fusca TaxID=39272 RepID=A0A8J2KV11_9HEXA|nr:unnamed protein product [Allacma fusca]